MSLRSELRAAIDEVARPAPMLASRIEAFVLAEESDRRVRSHRRRSRWTQPLRGMVAVLAAVLVVVLMVGLMLGGRLWRDWNHTVVRPTPINQTELKNLEAVPLNLPVVQPGAACPIGPLIDTPRESGLGPLTYGDGLGPVYTPGSGLQYFTAWGTYIYTGYVIRPPFAGLVLIRARDLQTNQRVVFARDPLLGDLFPSVPSGENAGTDFVLEHTIQRYSELVLQTQNMYKGPTSHGVPEWPVAYQLQGFPIGSSGCVGFQADGHGFTEHFVVGY